MCYFDTSFVMEREILKKRELILLEPGHFLGTEEASNSISNLHPPSSFLIPGINTHLLKQLWAYFLGSPLGRGMSHLREIFQLYHLNSIFFQGRPLFRIKHIAIIS